MGIVELIGLVVFVGLAYTAYWYNTKAKKTVEPEPNPTLDVAHKNIVETTESVTAKVEVEPAATPVAEAAPAPAKEQTWIKNPPAPIAKPKRQKQQSAKATTAPKKKKPAGK